jgi:hypothetical protein
MSGTPKDIDPSTELVEEDEEQSLPESDQAIDLATAAGPLAAGRAVIMRACQDRARRPGVYRMIDRMATCSTSARPRASASASSPIRGRPATTRASSA